MSFSYNIYIGTVLDPLTHEWVVPTSNEKSSEVTYDVIPHIPKKYYDFISYRGNDLYYFFEDLMLHDDLTSGVLLFTSKTMQNVPKFEDYYQKTARHFNDFSHKFQQECREKYYHLFMLFQYLHTHYEKRCFIYYEF